MKLPILLLALFGCYASHEVPEEPYERRVARALPFPCSNEPEYDAAACNVAVRLNHVARRRAHAIGCHRFRERVLYTPLADLDFSPLDVLWVLDEVERLASAETCEELATEPPLVYAE